MNKLVIKQLPRIGFLTRRRFSACSIIAAAVGWQNFDAIAAVRGNTEKLKLAELVLRSTAIVYIGKLNRIAFVDQEVSNKVYRQERLNLSELKLQDINKWEMGKGPTYMEILAAKPIWIAANAHRMPACAGKIYSHAFTDVAQNAELAKYVGQTCVFLFAGLKGWTKDGFQKTFPNPTYFSASQTGWEDDLPISIKYLEEIEQIASRGGFVRPATVVRQK